MNVLIHNNFLSDQECDELWQLFLNTKFKLNHSDGSWTNRVKWPNYSPYYQNKLVVERTKLCEEFFKTKLQIINLNLTIWKTGHEMFPHSDYGATNEFPDREYASLIYLNENYQGGELYIPELNFQIKPKKGQLLSFQGGKYLHGVRKIVSGERLTSICWFKPI